MNDIIEEILIIFLIIFLIFVISVVIIYIIQWITKLVWGEYEFTVIQDYEDYYTHSFNEKEGCINFINNYGQEKKWCEKYQVGENYFYKNSPNLKTVIFGY